MLDVLSEHMAQRIAQIVIANLAPVIQPPSVEEGQIVGVSALARYLECDRGRADKLASDPAFPKARMVGKRKAWSKADVAKWR
jgi:predicted DNA-binding transcriptional regulator AlpA